MTESTELAALADRLEAKYAFFKRMSFDGSEHETMVLLREAARALRDAAGENQRIIREAVEAVAVAADRSE